MSLSARECHSLHHAAGVKCKCAAGAEFWYAATRPLSACSAPHSSRGPFIRSEALKKEEVACSGGKIGSPIWQSPCAAGAIFCFDPRGAADAPRNLFHRALPLWCASTIFVCCVYLLRHCDPQKPPFLLLLVIWELDVNYDLFIN